jgi:hypothetical protein
MSITLASMLDHVRQFDAMRALQMAVPYSALSSAPHVDLLLLAHLSLFGLALGMMVWHTFFNGIVLFKTLSKPDFGRSQAALFPHYFRLSSFSLWGLLVCVFLEQHDVALFQATFTRLFFGANTHDGHAHTIAEILQHFARPFLLLTVHNVQMAILLGGWLASVTQQLLLGPLTTKLMFRRHRLTEELAKPGKNEDAALKQQLKSAQGKFGALHGISSLYNLGILLVVVAHGLYLATSVLTFMPNTTTVHSSTGVPAAAAGKGL